MATAVTFIEFSRAYALFLVDRVLRLSGALAFLFLFGINLQAKDWRGITPLKSTRADVERLLGKETRGSYEFTDERASIRYSQDPCEGPYQPLRKDYCECLVPKDTVLSIHVIPRVYKKFSPLQLDGTTYRREVSRPGSTEFIYSKSEEGVTYTVDESRDRIVAVDYAACAKDCQEVSKTRGQAQNSWRGLVPLHSTRADVDRLLGSPTFTVPSVGGYKTQSEGVMVRYVKQSCSSGGVWNVPLDTVLEIRVTPMTTRLLDQLDLDLTKYSRTESTHPENVFYYLNPDDGVMIQTRLRGESETLTSITYEHAAKDKDLRCPTPSKKSSLQPGSSVHPTSR
ncbi:MAG: hypothetical protein H7Z16_00130 [Pyrinomonadaceae bacterium]|nr:hypothetical protein [Pyrinomonadaceae bacterium]